jgi:hypothetical protein
VHVEPVKRPRLRKFVQDAMDEDRRPLGDLAPSEFYGEGCDASSYVTVDIGIEKPSGLSKECDFSTEEPEKTDDENVAPVVEDIVAPVVEDIVTPQDEENVSPIVEAAVAIAA